jgi:nitrogen-specific signal transduction histidine kinase
MSAPLDPPGTEAFDLLATMVALVRPDGRCEAVNSALENALCQSRRKLVQGQAPDWLVDPAPLHDALQRAGQMIVSRFEATLRGPRRARARCRCTSSSARWSAAARAPACCWR